MNKIQSVWPGISKVDAAYEYKKRNTVVFFEGTKLAQLSIVSGYCCFLFIKNDKKY